MPVTIEAREHELRVEARVHSPRAEVPFVDPGAGPSRNYAAVQAACAGILTWTLAPVLVEV